MKCYHDYVSLNDKGDFQCSKCGHMFTATVNGIMPKKKECSHEWVYNTRQLTGSDGHWYFGCCTYKCKHCGYYKL